MADFDAISAGLSTHFCERCGASFECDNEEGYCDCPFSNETCKVLCDSCTEAEIERQREEEAIEAEEEKE